LLGFNLQHVAKPNDYLFHRRTFFLGGVICFTDCIALRSQILDVGPKYMQVFFEAAATDGVFESLPKADTVISQSPHPFTRLSSYHSITTTQQQYWNVLRLRYVMHRV